MPNREDDLQEFFHTLESGAPHRDITILSLRVLAKTELDLFRTAGTAGTSWGTPAIVNAFLKALSRDSDPKIRSSIAKQLGEIVRDILRYQVEPLLRAAEIAEQGLIVALNDESPKVRKAATKALRKIGTPSALKAVPPKPRWQFW